MYRCGYERCLNARSVAQGLLLLSSLINRRVGMMLHVGLMFGVLGAIKRLGVASAHVGTARHHRCRILAETS